MSQFFYIHPDNPQARLIAQSVEIINKGGVIVYPTDSGYAIGCRLEEKMRCNAFAVYANWMQIITSP